MLLALYLESTSLDKDPGRLSEFLLNPKQAAASVLSTMDMGPLRLCPLAFECETAFTTLAAAWWHGALQPPPPKR